MGIQKMWSIGVHGYFASRATVARANGHNVDCGELVTTPCLSPYPGLYNFPEKENLCSISTHQRLVSGALMADAENLEDILFARESIDLVWM